MRCLHPCHRRFANIVALLCLVFLLMPCAALAARHRQRHATSRGQAKIAALRHRASHAVHASTRSTRSAGARLVRMRSARTREHHVRPHTARALRRARRHGTEAVRAAASHETSASPAVKTPTSESASLNLPEAAACRNESAAAARQPRVAGAPERARRAGWSAAGEG